LDVPQALAAKMTKQFPSRFNAVGARALRALGAVLPANEQTQARPDFLSKARATDAGQDLPPYYLVYFLFIELLEFRHLGRFEKVAWSVPLDFKGRGYLVEHRKFGLGLFAEDPEAQAEEARTIVGRINAAVKVARPFFDWLASEAIAGSRINVINNSSQLFERYAFLRRTYDAKATEAEARKDERIVERGTHSRGTWESFSFPGLALKMEADWLALSVIEAFFSWTEHVLIHLGVLLGRISSAQHAADVALANWPDKFKAVLDLSDTAVAGSYEQMMALRYELRNYVAHGAFGKQGEAFLFHSGAGAVPVLLPHKRGSRRFTLGRGLQFDVSNALNAIDGFITMLWSGARAPARLCIQEVPLPTVLTFATDGTYATAMQSEDEMRAWMDHWIDQLDTAANMDW